LWLNSILLTMVGFVWVASELGWGYW